jgi:aconitate hydratase
LVEREGGSTRYLGPPGRGANGTAGEGAVEEETTIYDAAVRYATEGVPLVILAGKEYGCGSSRDWAAKGTRLLGVRAVIAESFERIHRSNLIGMGVIPLQFPDGESIDLLGLTGEEVFEVGDLRNSEAKSVEVTARRDGADTIAFEARVRIDTPNEVSYLQHGGILHRVLRDLRRR